MPFYGWPKCVDANLAKYKGAPSQVGTVIYMIYNFLLLLWGMWQVFIFISDGMADEMSFVVGSGGRRGVAQGTLRCCWTMVFQIGEIRFFSPYLLQKMFPPLPVLFEVDANLPVNGDPFLYVKNS